MYRIILPQISLINVDKICENQRNQREIKYKKYNHVISSQCLKGESSHWINKDKFLKNKLQWQDDYFAVSVGESQVERVRAYIRNQEEHHKKRTFQEEVDEFMEKYGWKRMNDSVLG